MNTNGKQPAIDRDTVIREATYYAAIYGWYDTSKEAQESGYLTISVMDTAGIEPAEPDATHKFYVMINASGFMVTRQTGGRYEVTPHDQFDRQGEERELRAAVMDTALWFLTGEGAGYTLDPQPEAREAARQAAINELLRDEEPDEERDGGQIVHAVIRETEPDIMLAPSDAESPPPVAFRQWGISFGDGAYCEVGFFGYDENNEPALVAIDAEPDERDN